MKYFIVYILYSKSCDKFYIGQTTDLSVRLQQHNSHFYENSATQIANDWQIFFQINCTNKRQAILIEKHIKKMKSRKYIENLKIYPDITTNLLKKYQ